MSALCMNVIHEYRPNNGTTEPSEKRSIPESIAVLFPLMGIEIGMEIIYFHSDK